MRVDKETRVCVCGGRLKEKEMLTDVDADNYLNAKADKL